VRVAVTATNDSQTGVTATSAATDRVRATAPENTRPPSVIGDPVVGTTLTADPGEWAGTPEITFCYQWERCQTGDCDPIPGATEQTYTVTQADRGSDLRVLVSAANDAGAAPAAATPEPTPVQPPAATAPANTTLPSVGGTPQVGSPLSANPGEWGGTAPITYTYQWQRCDAGGGCVDIEGATSSTYTPTADDAGHPIRVVVTAANGAGSAASSESAPTAAVAAAPSGGTGAGTGGGTTTSPGTGTGTGGSTTTPGTGGAGPTPSTPSIPAAPVPATPVASAQATTVPSGAPVGQDLSGLAGSAVADGRCATLLGGARFRRIDLPQVGPVRTRVRSDVTVLPSAPVLVTVTPQRRGAKRGVTYTLDGRPLPGSSRPPYVRRIGPDRLTAGAHLLVRTLRPARGRTRTLRTTLRVGACATLYGVGQWRTTAGSALRMRIDSRGTIGGVTFTLPAVVARALATGAPSGRIRFVSQAGARQFTLKAGRAGRPASLAAAGGRPSVRVSGRTVNVAGLPEATGIVEVTLYQPRPPRGPRLLGPKARATATAILRVSPGRRLTTRIARGPG
jgi:hypothetical protein